MIPEVRPGAAKAAPGRAERPHRAASSLEHSDGIAASPHAESPPVHASDTIPHKADEISHEQTASRNPPESTEASPEAPVLPGDFAATLADEVTQRAELIMLAQRRQQDIGELAIDRMRSEFDIHEAKRAEYLREWNAIRDLSMEQMKKDDEILKKWIALI